MADDSGQAQGAPAHPGMMGDGTEEQNLGQECDRGARITEDEVKEAFANADAPKRGAVEGEAIEGEAIKGDAPKT